ncbi:MAG: hypothetical protein ACRDSQ_11820 [Actinokineospora sp.]
MTATIRKPSLRSRLRQVGRRWVRPKKFAIAWAKSFNACCCTITDPAASQGFAARVSVNWRHCSTIPGAALRPGFQ